MRTGDQQGGSQSRGSRREGGRDVVSSGVDGEAGAVWGRSTGVDVLGESMSTRPLWNLPTHQLPHLGLILLDLHYLKLPQYLALC